MEVHLRSTLEHKVDDRFWAKVNQSGTCWLWTGVQVAGGYGRVTRNGKKHLAHRYIYALCVGPIPAGYEVDHKCHTPQCVRPKHLQAVTPQQNKDNKRYTAKSNTGELGISYRPRDDNYVANLMRNGKSVYRKYFKDLEQAKTGLEEARIEYRNN